MRHRKPFLILAVVLLATPGSASATARLRVVSPSRDALVIGGRVAAEVAAPRGATRLTAALGGRDVSGAFRRVRPGVWRASLATGRLPAGPNFLIVRARGAAPDAVRFYRGARRRGLVRASVDGLGRGSAHVVVQVPVEPSLRLRMTLNGRDVTGALAPRLARRKHGRLGVDDGLRRGRNVLVVLAANRDGAYTEIRKTFVLPRRRTLVGAHSPFVAVAGQRLALRGTVLAARRLRSHRWTVVEAPRGANPRLLRPAALSAGLRLTQPGTYRVRFSAGGSFDEATVQAITYHRPLGVPVETTKVTFNGENPASFGIQLGSTLYNTSVNSGGFDAQVMLLDRYTLAVDYDQNFDGTAGDATTVTNAMNAHPGDLAIISIPDVENGGVNVAWQAVFQKIGWNPPSNYQAIGGYPLLSVVGLVGGPSGSAWVNPGNNEDSDSPGDMKGYFQTDAKQNFTFVPAEHVELDTSAQHTNTTNTMQVGNATYPSAAFPDSCATGGFQVVVLQAETLNPNTVTGGGTYETNGCGGPTDATNTQNLANYLVSLTNSNRAVGDLLVLIQSIGTPRDQEADPAWQFLGGVVESLGGTRGVLSADTGSYALVGHVGQSDFPTPYPLLEASESAAQASLGQAQRARITGLLARTQTGAFLPESPSTTGPFGLGLATLAYGPQSPDPDPTSGERNVLAFLAENSLQLTPPTLGNSCYLPRGGVPDVRSSYCNNQFAGSWGTWSSQLRGVMCPKNPPPASSFSCAMDWPTVIGQLANTQDQLSAGEFAAVNQALPVFAALKGEITQQEISQLPIAQAVTGQIFKSLAGPPANTTGNWEGFLGDLSKLGSQVFEGSVAQSLGVLGAALTVAKDTTTNPNGTLSTSSFSLAASQVPAALQTALTDQSMQIDQLAAIILTDPAKLETFRGGGYGFSAGGTSTNQAVALAAAQFAWKALLPAAYELVKLRTDAENTGVTNARDYACAESDTVRTYAPFPRVPDSAQLSDSSGLYVLVQRGARLPDGEEPISPPTPAATLTDPLFEAPAFDSTGVPNQFGFYKPWFFRQAFAGRKVREVTGC